MKSLSNRFTRRVSYFLVVGLLLNVTPAVAQTQNPATTQEVLKQLKELRNVVGNLQATVNNQQHRIQALESENAALRADKPAVAAPDVATVSQSASTGRQNLSAFNPEIGIVGDIFATTSESDEDAEGNDKISVRELELVIGHDVDPFSRFDSTVTFSDFEDVAVEEAFVSHWGIPWIKARLGRMRQRIGMASSTHRDALDTVDEPLVVQRYLGIEGLFRSGLELSGFIPAPWEAVSHEFVGGVMEGGVGEDGELFGVTRRRPSYYVGLQNFWEISDRTSLTANGTWLVGSADDDSKYEVNAFGVHTRLLHNLDPIQRVKLQAEVYFQDRDQAASIAGEDGAEEELADEVPSLLNENPYGYYVLADYRFAQRWAAGFRFDTVEPTNAVPEGDDKDTAYTGYLTLGQSEFARWRIQYQHLDGAGGDDDDRFSLQGTFAIGVHKHQLQ